MTLVKLGILEPRTLFQVPNDSRVMEVVRQSAGLRTTVRPRPGFGKRNVVTVAGLPGEDDQVREFETRSAESMSAGTLVKIIDEAVSSDPGPLAPEEPDDPTRRL